MKWPKGPESRGIHLSLLIDVSGSMKGPKWNLLVKSLNAYLDTLKQSLNDYTITIVFYDSGPDDRLRYILRSGATPLSQIKPLEEKEYLSGGLTPTRDALIQIATETKTFAKAQNPSRCLIVLFTDGDDNMSINGTGKINRLVRSLESEIFGFIGVIIGGGTWGVQERLGISDDSIITCTGAKIDAAVAAVASTTVNYVRTGSTAISFKDKKLVVAR